MEKCEVTEPVQQPTPSGAFVLSRHDFKVDGVRTCMWTNWQTGEITVHIGGKRTVKLSMDDYNNFEGNMREWLSEVLAL